MGFGKKVSKIPCVNTFCYSIGCPASKNTRAVRHTCASKLGIRLAGIWCFPCWSSLGKGAQTKLRYRAFCADVCRSRIKRIQCRLCWFSRSAGKAPVFSLFLPQWRRRTCNVSEILRSEAASASLASLSRSAVYQGWRKLQKLQLFLQSQDAVREFPAAWLARLDHRTGGLFSVFLLRRVFVSSQRAHERYKPRHCADAGSSYEPVGGTTAVLLPHQAHRYFSSLFRWQQQRGP